MKKSSLGRRPSNSKSSFTRLAVERSSRDRDRLSGIPVRLKKSESYDNIHVSAQSTSSIRRPKSANRPVDATPVSSGSGYSANRRLTTDRLTSDRYLSSGSRTSSIGGSKSKKDNRPLLDKEWQAEAKARIENALALDLEGNSLLMANKNSIKPLSLALFLDIVLFFFTKLDQNIKIDKSNYVNELPYLCKKMNYKGRIDRSWLISINTAHSWTHALGLLHFLASCYICKTQASPLELMYPETFEENDNLNFKLLLPYYINSYELYLNNKPDYLKQQEEYDMDVVRSHYEQDNLNERLEEIQTNINKLEEKRAILSDTKLGNRNTLKELEENNSGIVQQIKDREKYNIDLKQHSVNAVSELSAEQERNLAMKIKIKDAREKKNKLIEQIKNQKLSLKDVHEMKKTRDALNINLKNDQKFVTEFETTIMGSELEILRLKKTISENAIKYNLKLASYSSLYSELVQAEIPNNADELSEVNWETKKIFFKKVKKDLEDSLEILKQQLVDLTEKKLNIESTNKLQLKLQQEIEELISTKTNEQTKIEEEIKRLDALTENLEEQMPQNVHDLLLKKKEERDKFKENLETMKICWTKSIEIRGEAIAKYNEELSEMMDQFEAEKRRILDS